MVPTLMGKGVFYCPVDDLGKALYFPSVNEKPISIPIMLSLLEAVALLERRGLVVRDYIISSGRLLVEVRINSLFISHLSA